MGFVGDVLDQILSLPPIWLYLAVAALVFAEDAIFVGFAVPGESAAVIAGVATALTRADLVLAIVIVVAAAILGDTVGYEVGKRFFGPKVLDSRFVRRHRERVEGAEDLLRRRGGPAVLLGRFTAFFRAMMPALAGASGMRYRTFLIWNALGGIVWGTLWVLVGHAAGASYQSLESRVGRGVLIAVVAVVLVALVVWRVRAHRRS